MLISISLKEPTGILPTKRDFKNDISAYQIVNEGKRVKYEIDKQEIPQLISYKFER